MKECQKNLKECVKEKRIPFWGFSIKEHFLFLIKRTTEVLLLRFHYYFIIMHCMYERLWHNAYIMKNNTNS